ncbi:MAG: hypothetical protein AVDCRST_MAG85-100, partial [uncultured Solirubrobacteraceae bacterium]
CRSAGCAAPPSAGAAPTRPAAPRSTRRGAGGPSSR